uniref:Lipocalin/cytosolic fatty-acid binding domain-containing protein n=1 Tax=Graphocephala atropunctata TaxID=36148 RepID=A0A1B6LU15_9HEMI
MSTSPEVCIGVLLACMFTIAGVRGYEVGEEVPLPTARSKYTVPRHRLLCTKSQSNIDFKELMGLWNVIEVIEHSDRYNDRRNYLRAVSRSDSCPVVHFATDDDREVRMLWNDEEGYIQYSFRMTNINNPGFWMSLGYQSGTMVDNAYEHFSGTAQVMKAVQSHMVLTFCSPHERHFSIILARNKYLSHEEIRGVHKQLNRVNLPLVAVQGYCRNSGVSTNPSTLLAVLLTLVVIASKRVSL